MARARSPQYPVIGLREAIEKVRLVWKKDYTNEIPRQIVAEHMGYNSLNGKSLGVLSAAGKFGLLVGRGDETRVSALAVRILAHESGAPERGEAVKDAASMPALFSDIESKFEGRRISDQALRSHLLTRGFTHGAVDVAIRAYRETEELVEEECGRYDGSEPMEEGQDMDAPPTEARRAAGIDADTAHFEMKVGDPGRLPGRIPTVTLGDDGLALSGGVLTSIEQFDKLMKRLNAARVLLETDDERERDQPSG